MSHYAVMRAPWDNHRTPIDARQHLPPVPACPPAVAAQIHRVVAHSNHARPNTDTSIREHRLAGYGLPEDLPEAETKTKAWEAWTPEKVASERARREPIADDLVAALDEFYRTDRPDHHRYHTFAAKRDNGDGWRPVFRPYSPEVLRRSIMGLPTDDKHAANGCGRYVLDQNDETDWFAFDIDAHKKGEAAELATWHLQFTLDRMKIDYLIARSSSGSGYHIVIKLSRKVKGCVVRRFAAWIKRRADVSPKIEVFPKQDRLCAPVDGASSGGSKSAGVQIAVPSSLVFYARKGGGAILDKNLNEIPIEECAAHVRAIRRVSVDALSSLNDQLLATEENHRCFFKEQVSKPRTTVAHPKGVPSFQSADDISAWLAEQGVEVSQVKTSEGGRYKILLRHCPGNPHGSSKTDGSAVLFNEHTGDVWFKCHHAACDGFEWSDLLKKWGHKIEQVPLDDEDLPPPPPDLHISHREGTRERVFMTNRARKFVREVAEIEYGKTSNVKDAEKLRVRMKRVSLCCQRDLQDVTSCDDHGDQDTIAMVCGRRTLCVSCSTSYAISLEKFIIQNFDKLHVVLIETEPDEHTPTAHRQLVSRRKAVKNLLWKPRHWTRCTYRIQDGIRRGGVLTTPNGISRTNEWAKINDFSWVKTFSFTTPDEVRIGARLISDIYAEPALEVKAAAEARDYNRLVFAVETFANGQVRTSGNRVTKRGDGKDAAGIDPFPWYSEAQADEDAIAEAKEKHGPEWNSGKCRVPVVKEDGTSCPCGKKLRHIIRLAKEDIYRSKRGAPGWAARAQGWRELDSRDTLFVIGAATPQTQVA